MAKGHDRQARHAAYRSLAFSRSAVASLAGGIPKRDFHATEHRGLPAAARTVALHLRVEAGIRVEARTRSKRTISDSAAAAGLDYCTPGQCARALRAHGAPPSRPSH